MKICVFLSEERFFNDVGEVLRLFFPGAKVLTPGASKDLAMADTKPEASEIAALRVKAGDGGVSAEFRAADGNIMRSSLPCPAFDGAILQKRHLKRAYKLAVYRALKSGYGRPSPWGSLTGIRPAKFARGLIEELSGSPDYGALRAALISEFDIREDKVELLLSVLETQEGLEIACRGELCSPAIPTTASIDIAGGHGNPPLHDCVDVYIGIPFCATRCSYCSFAAEALSDYSRVKAYLTALFQEMDDCKALAANVRALYIGGGTPTSLAPREFEQLLEKAAGLAPRLEFAVEAGRPDTLSREKLAIMKRYGVTRTSVNPQTMSDATLERIGRAHTSADVIRAFELTRECGIPVNADIIIGLPGETPNDVANTLEALEALAPEGFTAHTLALKRASRMVISGESALPSAEDAEAMLDMTREYARKNGMNPYYLYRQKYMAGNLENVGYAKPGFECLYNIDIMEETTSILAFGAGAITKWIFGGGRLERSPNPKDVDTYIMKVDELARRKFAMLN